MAIDLQGLRDSLTNSAGLNPSNFVQQNPSGSGWNQGIVPGSAGSGLTDPSQFYYKLTYAFLYFVGTIAFLILIYGGILYITAQGEAEQVERAKKTIFGSIIGIIIIAVAFAAYSTFVKQLANPGSNIQQTVQENPFK